MANYANLKLAIQDVVKTNGNNEITGALLQQSLLAMINSLGAGYQFIGIATPSTNPGTPDQNVFYIASVAGTYSNFNGIVLNDGEVALLTYNGTWTKQLSGFASQEKVDALSDLIGINYGPNYGTLGYKREISDLPVVGKLNPDGTIDPIYTSYRCSGYLPLDNVFRIYYYRTTGTDGILLYDKDFSVIETFGWTSGLGIVNLSQYPNAAQPILITLSGITTLVKLVQ